MLAQVKIGLLAFGVPVLALPIITPAHPATWQLHLAEGRAALRESREDAARDYFEQSLDEAERNGVDGAQVVEVLNLLALVTFEPQKRQAYLERVLSLEEAHPGSQSIEVAEALGKESDEPCSPGAAP